MGHQYKALSIGLGRRDSHPYLLLLLILFLQCSPFRCLVVILNRLFLLAGEGLGIPVENGDICPRALLDQRGQDLGWFLVVPPWPTWLWPALVGDPCDILVPAWPWGGASELSGPWVC